MLLSKKHILELLAKTLVLEIYSQHQMQYQYNLVIHTHTHTHTHTYIYIYIYIYICIYYCQFDKVDLLNTNLQLSTNMKVNSNLSQHVSSFLEGSVAITLEFPSRIIWSTHWFYKPGKCPKTIYFIVRGLQVTHELGGLMLRTKISQESPFHEK